MVATSLTDARIAATFGIKSNHARLSPHTMSQINVAELWYVYETHPVL